MNRYSPDFRPEPDAAQTDPGVTLVPAMIVATSALRGAAACHTAALHIQEAGIAQAARMARLSHEIAALWLSPAPFGPVAAAVRAERTRAMLLRHWIEAGDDAARRFDAIRRTVIAETHDLTDQS